MKTLVAILAMIWLTQALPQDVITFGEHHQVTPPPTPPPTRQNVVTFPEHPGVDTKIANKEIGKDCYTTEGPDPGKKCIFPFIHGATEYHDCTRAGHKEGKLWCSTKVDRSGRHLAGQNFFGICAEPCFSNSNKDNHVWSNWGNWGACSAFCGGVSEGTQERTRSCTGTNCVGSKKEIRSCLNSNKCAIGDPCKNGSTWKQDCNTCICTKEAKTTCTTNVCPTPPPTPAPNSNPCTSDRDDVDPQCTNCTRSNICVTDSGPTSHQQCVFPFKWGGKTFNNCDVWRWGGKDEGKFWCSTKTDANGVHVNGQGNYGFCPHTEACRGPDLTVNTRLLDSDVPELQIAPH